MCQCDFPAQPRLMRVVTRVAVAVGALALHGAANAEVNLTVEVISGYTDNLQRQPQGEDEIPVSLGLTGTWVETTRRVSADVEGRVDGIKYLNDAFDDEVVGQLDGSVTLWPVPDRFAWVVENVYGQVATDPFAPISPVNRQNTNFFSTGPDWYIPIGERMHAYLGGRYESVEYEVVDTDNQRLSAMAGVDRAVSSSSRLGMRVNSESVDFDSALQSDFDRHEAYVTYEFSREQRQGERQSSVTMNAGYTWLAVGDNDSSLPLLELSLTRAISPSLSVGLGLASRFSDAGLEFAAGGRSGQAAGVVPGVIPEASVFEERGGRGTIDFDRERTTLSVAVGLADELYETATLDRRRYDVYVSIERRMTRRLTGSAGVLWSLYEYETDGLDREDTDYEYRLELRREIGERTSLAIVGLHASRSSDDPLVEFDETRGFLVFDYSLL